eukprot:gb/GFBE01067608.1/.p1 GENE.gb/GFBE01067608.1/~~gb/GFBE01067608.1/.p1  ORF type:complete len:201 (+),score=41.15 gb/GFBE01067608.1/:1-603(+)
MENLPRETCSIIAPGTAAECERSALIASEDLSDEGQPTDAARRWGNVGAALSSMAAKWLEEDLDDGTYELPLDVPEVGADWKNRSLVEEAGDRQCEQQLPEPQKQAETSSRSFSCVVPVLCGSDVQGALLIGMLLIALLSSGFCGVACPPVHTVLAMLFCLRGMCPAVSPSSVATYANGFAPRFLVGFLAVLADAAATPK